MLKVGIRWSKPHSNSASDGLEPSDAERYRTITGNVPGEISPKIPPPKYLFVI